MSKPQLWAFRVITWHNLGIFLRIRPDALYLDATMTMQVMKEIGMLMSLARAENEPGTLQ